MIGVFDYTIILTYLSMISAGLGIIFSLSNGGHPYIGSFFLLFSGLCDAFDGRVARTKKNRTEEEKKFGIQIDSLSDLIAFGVLPACIGIALFNRSPFFMGLDYTKWYAIALKILIYGVLVIYMLSALIRLAYYNVTEEEREQKEDGVRKTYIGLPVTSAALIFPMVLFIEFITKPDFSWLYFILIIVTAFLFVLKFNVKKADSKGLLIMILIGFLEFILLFIAKFLK